MRKLMCLILLILCSTFAYSRTVVEKFGYLSVKNGYIENDSGQRIQLTGIGSHGLQWFGHFYTKEAIQYLRDDWGATVIRAAMYTNEGGYISNRSVKNKVYEIINSALDLGVYVIVDWHILSDGNPMQYVNEAKEFFKEISDAYPYTPNIIFEICNEPNGWGVGWEGQIKPYAEQVIPLIRQSNPDSIVIVGTPTWSSNITAVENNLLSFPNISYALHFYGNHDGDGQRANVLRMLSKGISIFVSEWGTSSTSGDGGPYIDQSVRWLNFMREHKISWVNWNFSNHRESSAAFQTWTSSDPSTWTDNNLKEGAKLVKENITRYLLP